MDKDADARLTFDEFVEGSKLDPTIVQVLNDHPFVERSSLTTTMRRHYHYTTVLCNSTLAPHATHM
jgi:hypothetical protein